MKHIYVILAVLISIAVVPGFAQQVFTPSTKSLFVNAKPVASSITIDGILSEAAWSEADSLGNFIQIEPHQGEAARDKTVVKIMYDDKYVYFGIFCYDSLGRKAIRVPDLKRDFSWKTHDTFAICIDGFRDKRNSVSFVTNPYGVQKDYLAFDALLYDEDWNGLWKVRTSITSSGWFAEFQIPWKTLRYAFKENVGQSWGVNFLRLRRASNEISAWSPYPRSFSFNRMEYAGEIRQLQPPAPKRNIQFNPYALIRFDKKSTDSYTNSGYDIKPGGEVKWSVSPNTTVDLTANTDFAQADADLQVNNVSRFSILFPEKRQFFLENASLFGPGLLADGVTGGNMQILPFFSRRIGLSSSGSPIPIQGGIRLTHRSVHQNGGVMAVHQAPMDSIDAVDYAVLRYSRNFGKQNRIGTIGTMRSTNGDINVVGGIDGFVRFNSSSALNVMALGSHDHGSTNGFGGFAQYYYVTNRITAWLTETILTKNFNPELGFVSRTDVIGTSAGAVANLRGKHLPLRKLIRSWQPAIHASVFHQSSTLLLTEREIRITPIAIEMQDGAYVTFGISNVLQHLPETFTPLGISIPPGKYSYTHYSVTTGSDASRKISYTLQHDFGKYYDRTLQTTEALLSIVPIPHISLKAGVNVNRFNAVPNASGSETIAMYTIQGRLALNPRLQVSGIYQRNTQSSADSYNLRFAWEYRALSYVYLVFNSRENFDNLMQRELEHQGIFKISLLQQF